jgi:SanA protein
MADLRAPAGAGAGNATARFFRRLVALFAALGGAGLLFLVLGNVYVLRAAQGGIYASASATPPATAAIVLGTQVYPDGTPSIQLEDRLAAALDLYRAGKVKRILVSGATGGDHDEAGAMSAWLIARGVPRAQVFLDRQGFRTMATMIRAARVFGVRDAVVCTQLYHLPRALVLASKSGIAAVGLIADRQEYPNQWIRYTSREMIARPTMLLESALLGMRAQGLDQRFDIEGPSDASWTR